ncbi:uncharacterized protein LOC135226623 [Macrobrachium nipponense]|uniref:uncharacterized protein LOC135226623 n=1 Tax=Macrobrachium nipponense TaxID=159736 RepID=UPI0030C8604C
MQSVFSPSREDCEHPPNATATLVAANGSPICCYGTQTRRISILSQKYEWPFVIVDVKFPILGAGFLPQHGLLVDVGYKRLLDTGTYYSRPLTAGPGMPSECAAMSYKYTTLLHEFPDIFKPELCQVPGTQAKHGIHHHITTTGPPIHPKFCCLLPKKLQNAKQAFQEIERMGTCKKTSSPWASPLPHGEEARRFLCQYILTTSQRQLLSHCSEHAPSPTPPSASGMPGPHSNV